MKAFELFGLYESFTRLMDSQAFTNQQKLCVGSEMIHSLPPPQFCVSTPKTYDSVKAAMQAAVEKINASSFEAAKPQEGQEATQAAQEAPAPAAKGRNRKG